MNRARLFNHNCALGRLLLTGRLPYGLSLWALATALLAACWALPQTARAATAGPINTMAESNIPITATHSIASLATNVLQPGYTIYASKAYGPNQPTLMVRDLRQMGQRYADPANLAGSAMDNSPFAPVVRTWNASEFGGNPVMGVAFDSRTGEIYVSASFLYNIGPNQPPFTNPIAAQVYRISPDGNTVELFATLPGSKGTGWLDIDQLHDQLYVSDLDDGLIYRVPLGGGVGQSGPFATFAPHAADAINESTAPTPPDWNMAPLGERVLGVGFNATDSRLYYSIWANDLHNTGIKDDPGYATTTLSNTVRSVQIAPDGSFVPGTDLLEVTLPKMGVGFSMPVSDITFNAAGTRMLLAEQGFDSISGWGAFSHTSRILEYTGVTGAWAAEPLNKFDIGLCCGGPHNPGGANSRGGVAFAPGGYSSAGYTIGSEDFVIATADSVADDYSIPDHHYYVDGAGFMPATGSFSSLAVAGLDLDGNRLYPSKGSYGDIDVLEDPAPLGAYDLALVNVVNTAASPGPFATGDGVTFTLTIYNQGTQPVTNIQISDTFPAGLTLNDPAWSSVGADQAVLVTPIPNLAPGASITINIAFIINAASGTLTQYAEITTFADSVGSPATDADSSALLGAGNDPAQVDNYIYGTLAGEDHDDLDPASIALGTVGIGNLVFIDTNGNYHADPGEGQDGITVELLRPGYGPDGIAATADDHDPITTTVTAGGGEYAFTGLPPGGYVVVIPYPMFAAGAPLDGYTTLRGSGGDDGIDDNVDENGRDPNASTIPALTVAGVSSGLINLAPGGEPTGEGGFDGAGNSPDADIDYTVDFGFFQSVGIGNLVWLDFDGDGKFTAGEGMGGIDLELYRPGVGPDGIVGNSDDATVVAITTTNNNGAYAFTGLEPGAYVVKIPASVFQLGHSALNGSRSLPGNGGDDGKDDDVDENGIDTRTPEIDGVSSALITLTPGTEPTSSETGANGGSDTPDANIDYTVDFGFSPLVALGNEVWLDANHNGIYDAGEGVDGVTVELLDIDGGPDGILHNGDENDPIQTFTTTSDGLYYFLAYTGNFVVRIPATQFQPGGPLTGYTSLPGAGGDNQVDDNVDENGIDAAHPELTGIASAPIALAANTEPINEPGRPFPSTIGPFDPDIDFTIDFGFVRTPVAQFGDRVWLESDDDSLASTGVITPVLGMVITATASNNTVYTATTNSQGYYSFTVPVGTYTVNYGQPPVGTLPSATPNDGTVDQASPGTDQVSQPNNTVVTLQPGDKLLTVDFGFYQPLSLGNLVWFDSNNNGVVDAGEPGIAGATVTLYLSGSSTPVQTTTADANGKYLFTNLTAGEYIVEVTTPNGYVSSSDIATSATPESRDNDDNGVTLTATTVRSTVVTLQAGTEPANESDQTQPINGVVDTTPPANSNFQVDFGFYRPVSVGNYIWIDANGDGKQDATEQPLPGATVRLFNADGVTPATDVNGTPVPAQTTGSDGKYLFTNLSPGDYVIQVAPPAGYVLTQGGVNPNNDDNTDSNGVTVGNAIQSLPVTLTAGAEPTNDGDTNPDSNLTVDFGFYQPVKVGDRVWYDSNGNGQQDNPADEPGVPNVKVTLYDATTHQAVLVNGQPLTVQTDSNGAYLFANLAPGNYYVVFDLTTLPAGYGPTTLNAPGVAENANSDANPSTGQTRDTGFLSGGTQDLNLDMGIVAKLNLGNLVWSDLNNNGLVDVGEPGLPGVVLQLFAAGANPSTATPLAQTTTDATGHYTFTNLLPGGYFVYIPTPLAGYPKSSTPTDTNDDGKDNDDNGSQPGGPGKPVSSPLITLQLGTEPTTDGDGANGDLTIDFGFYQPAGLGDRVWLDNNKNGVQDVGEHGVPGVVVNLYTANGDLVATTTTDVNGDYQFLDLVPGQYYVGFILPPNYEISPPHVGGDGTDDSDVDVTTGHTQLITIGPGDYIPNLDAGIFQTPDALEEGPEPLRSNYLYLPLINR